MSDPHELTCSPLEVLEESDEERLVLRLIEVAERHGVGQIVVGLPRPLSGRTNRQMEKVLAFVRLLEARTVTPVATWDERYTSKLARRGRTDPRQADSVAACYILQSYLDAQKGSRVET